MVEATEVEFTTVRDVGGEVVLAARNAVNNGYINGPRIFSAGRSIGTTGGHADPSSGLNRKFRGDPGPHEAVVNGVDDFNFQIVGMSLIPGKKIAIRLGVPKTVLGQTKQQS